MIELLLSEHHADCTNCDKNGKCELQNQASEFKIINVWDFLEGLEASKAHENPEAAEICDNYLEHPCSPHAKDLLHTSYTRRKHF